MLHRYVDTFNKGGGGTNGALTNTFQSPTVPPAKPLIGANFFVPMAPATTDKKPTDAAGDNNNREVTTGEDPSEPAKREASFSSLPSSASSSMEQLPSINSITPQNNNAHVSRSRAASWSGNYESFNEAMAGARLGHGSSLQQHDTSLGDDLQEVEL